MNEPNFWAIRFIRPPVSSPVIQPPALSPQPVCYPDVHGISAKLKQVNWFTFLAFLQMNKF